MIKILYEILKNKQKEALKSKTSWLTEFTQILTNDAKNCFLGLKTAHKALWRRAEQVYGFSPDSSTAARR